MEFYSFETIFFVVSIQESKRSCSESIFPSKQTIPFCCCKYPPNSSPLNSIITLKQLWANQSQDMANCVLEPEEKPVGQALDQHIKPCTLVL